MYTERARRALFFARLEASEIGGLAVETDHVLLGLLRAGKGYSSTLFARSDLSHADVKRAVEALLPPRERYATTVELPFSDETRRILQFASEEAESLGHNYVGTEHLLLGVLREEKSIAATLLIEKGIFYDEVRREIARLTRG